jgi:hypothetical protein
MYWLQFQFSGLVCRDSLTLQFAQYELDNKANDLEIRQQVSETLDWPLFNLLNFKGLYWILVIKVILLLIPLFYIYKFDFLNFI